MGMMEMKSGVLQEKVMDNFNRSGKICRTVCDIVLLYFSIRCPRYAKLFTALLVSVLKLELKFNLNRPPY
jgi:hypothetical protein